MMRMVDGVEKSVTPFSPIIKIMANSENQERMAGERHLVYNTNL